MGDSFELVSMSVFLALLDLFIVSTDLFLELALFNFLLFTVGSYLQSLSNIHTLYCQKYSLTCLDSHMNLSDIPFLIHRV